MTFAITIPGDPCPKGRPRANSRGSIYTDQKTRQAENEIRLALRAARAPLMSGPLQVTLRFYRKNRRRADLDNLIKLVSDAANGILWDDDSQIIELIATVDKGCPNPRTELEVRQYVREAA